MTELLEKAINEVAKLSPDQQDEIASLLLAELESERTWASTFGRSQEALARLGQEAVGEFERRETEGLDPDKL
jgi:hypothetical protein